MLTTGWAEAELRSKVAEMVRIGRVEENRREGTAGEQTCWLDSRRVAEERTGRDMTAIKIGR